MMRTKRKSFGQGAVEFALILPILVVFLVGIMEVGRLIFIYVSVMNATREASRFGQVTAEIAGVAQYQNCTGIKDRALAFRFIADFEEDDIDIVYDQGPGTTPSPECESMSSANWDDIDTGSRIVVSIDEEYSPVIPFIPLGSFTITSTNARTIIGAINYNP